MILLLAFATAVPVAAEDRIARMLDDITARTVEAPQDSDSATRGRSDARPGANPLAILNPVSAAEGKAARALGLDRFRCIFASYGLPEGLVQIGHVESGFRAGAVSNQGARGIWQLMPATARELGLSVGLNDERSDPEKSTHAAAVLLRRLYNRFGEWKLTLAAYNAGPARLESAIEKGGTRDFNQLVNLGLIPAETASYVPAVLSRWALAGAMLEDGDNASGEPADPVKVVHALLALSN